MQSFFFKAHVLHRAGYDKIDPRDAWVEESPYYDDDVYFDIAGTTFCLRVKPYGIFEQHKGSGKGCIWTNWIRITK